MKNKPIDLYNNLTYENGFTVLFLGSDTRYSEAMQYVYNMHWNSVVTTFSLEANKIGIAAARFDAIENYRKVNPIGIADVEKRKNLFNKKKLIAFSCESCLEEPRYRPVFNKYLYDLCNKLGFGGTLILDGITVDEYEKLGINQYIWDLQKGNVFFFRCSDALRSRILSDLKVEEAETFSFFSDGVEEYLEEYLEDDSEYAYDEDNPDDVIYYFSGGKRRSFEKRKLIDTSGLIKLISTEDIDGKKVAHFLAEQYFYAFIKDSKERKGLTLAVSSDNGQTWKDIMTLQESYAAYSTMVVFRNGDLGVLYEDGSNSPDGGYDIVFLRVPRKLIKESIKEATGNMRLSQK